jgi:hypothetical protein
MMRATFALLLALLGAELRAQVVADTAVSVTGVVRAAPRSPCRWGLMLPQPLVFRGVHLDWLLIETPCMDAGNHEDLFVAATGTLRLRYDSNGALLATLADLRLQEQAPPHAVTRNVQLSLTQRAAVSLAVEPAQFAWFDSAGAATGVRPLLFFSVVNHADVPIRVFFSGNEVFCVRVRSLQPFVADTSWSVLKPGVPSFSIRMGQWYRGVIELPPSAAPRRGRYRVRVELCAAREYGAELLFDVDR